MQLSLKSVWKGTTGPQQKVANEFLNIQQWCNNLDSGINPLTSASFAGDLTDQNPGSGLIVTTPNGLHTYRIAIDNSGELTTQQIT